MTSLNNTLGKKILNDFEVSFIDRSRKISGDRWSVELVCEASVHPPENFWDSVPEEDNALLDSIRGKMGSCLKFSVSKIRNFLPNDDKQAVIAKLAGDFEERLIQYSGKPEFKLNLFEKEYNAARQECFTEMKQDQAAGPLEDEDTGPADFSRLFE